MPAAADNNVDGPDERIYRNEYERRVVELEQELEFAKKQAEIERKRAEAVASHLITENQNLRQGQQAPPKDKPREPSVFLKLAHRLAGRLTSCLLSAMSCAMFIVLALLIYAYWPEILEMVRIMPD